MIVAMPNGRPRKDVRPRGNIYAAAPTFAVFEEDLLKDVIPAVESHYAAQADREGEAGAPLDRTWKQGRPALHQPGRPCHLKEKDIPHVWHVAGHGRDRVEGQSLLLRTARFPMTSHRDRRVTKPGRASDIFQREESRSVITLEESVWGEERGRSYFGLLGASVRQTAVAQTDERPADRLAEQMPPPLTVRERPTRQEDRPPRHER